MALIILVSILPQVLNRECSINDQSLTAASSDSAPDFRLGMYYPRGATVGGSSQTNAMSVALPPQSDWAEIAALTGDDSWSPENIRATWMAMERNTYMPRNATGYGFNGYLAVRFHLCSHPYFGRYLIACSNISG